MENSKLDEKTARRNVSSYYSLKTRMPSLLGMILAVFTIIVCLIGVVWVTSVDSSNSIGHLSVSSQAKVSYSATSLGCAPAWRVVTSPNPSSNEDNYLFDIDALTPSDAWAAGKYSINNQARSMLLNWNGIDWKLSPSSVVTEALSNGVSIISASDVWAVGRQWRNGPEATFIMHWDGKQW